MCYAVLSPQAHRLRRLLAGAQVHPPIGKVQPLAELVPSAGFHADFFEAERLMERAALFVLAGHKGNGVAVTALAHAVQQGFVQPPANPLAHTVVGAVNGQLHIPRISCAAVPGVGAGTGHTGKWPWSG